MTLSVLHVSTYATNGGAARAASALNFAMLNDGIDSRILTAHGTKFRIASELDRRLWKLQRTETKTWRSPAFFKSLNARILNESSADVINLHWVTDGFLSIEEIGKITKPVVWSMYDMWPFCGTEHYGVNTPDARWRTGYTTSNRPSAEAGLDIDRWTWERKLKNWSSMHMVPASSWMLRALKSSKLMNNWPSTRIPHVIDCELFRPMGQDEARDNLNLPKNVPLIVFLASAGITDSRKGFDLLAQALPKVQENFPSVEVAIAGPASTVYTLPGAIPVHWVGQLNSNEQLRSLYCSATVVATPSREDNMPLTAMEAQSCGRPVVAFDIGGLPDIVVSGETGYLARELNVKDLASGLINTLTDAMAEDSMGIAARKHALQTWSQSVVVKKYLDLYATIS